MVASVATGLRITIVTPTPRGSLIGNRTTALRWAGLLRQLGHRVRIDTEWRGRETDVLVAVHAVKTAPAVLLAAAAMPGLAIVTLLAGTDIYPTFAPDAETLTAMQRADALIALQPLALDLLPASLRGKARTIVQSATAIPTPRKRRFTAVLLAHLRPVKQPLLAIEALALVPEHVDMELVLAGRRLDDGYGETVARALAATHRARWLGELSRRQSKQLLAASHVCLVPSSSEGGANVVSEAIAAGTPVLCSRIPGNLGLLGADWPATFAVGDAGDLASLLTGFATDPASLDALCRRTVALQPMVAASRERDAWRQLLAEIAPKR